LHCEAESSQEEALRQVSPSVAVVHYSLFDLFIRAKPIQLFAIPGIDSSGSTSSSGLFPSTKQAGIPLNVEKSDKEKENSDAQRELERF